MASSSNYGRVKFNLAAQGHRQAGSTFKVMVLMTALRRGVNPNSTYLHLAPARSLGWLPGYPSYGVQTYGAQLRGLDRSSSGDAEVRQHRLRAARRRPRPRGGQADRAGHGHHDPPRRLPGRGPGRPAPRRLAAGDGQRLRDDRLRRLSATSRSPSRRSSSRTASPRTSASPSARARSPTASPPRPRRSSRPNVQGGTGVTANIGCPAAGKTGHDRQLQRRLVRRLHAEAHDRGVGRLSPTRRSRCAPCTASRSPAARSRPMIWHDYMDGRHGSDCSDFRRPQERLFQPFFGKYSSNGYSGGGGGGGGTDTGSSNQQGSGTGNPATGRAPAAAGTTRRL